MNQKINQVVFKVRHIQVGIYQLVSESKFTQIKNRLIKLRFGTTNNQNETDINATLNKLKEVV